MRIPMQMTAGAAVALMLSAGAFSARAAEEATAAAAAAPSMAPLTTQPPAVERVNPLGVKPMEAGLLAKSRGGTQVLNDMKLRGTVANNRATDVVTGSNIITDGAMAGAAGLPMVIQNSGNNVLIQNATIVNVQMK